MLGSKIVVCSLSMSMKNTAALSWKVPSANVDLVPSSKLVTSSVSSANGTVNVPAGFGLPPGRLSRPGRKPSEIVPYHIWSSFGRQAAVTLKIVPSVCALSGAGLGLSGANWREMLVPKACASVV